MEFLGGGCDINHFRWSGASPKTFAMMNATCSQTVRPCRLAAAAFAAFLLLPEAATAQNAPVQAGVSAAVRGNVQLTRAYDGTVGRRLDSGEAIFLDDVIAAGPKAAMQIMLLDETVFTIGANSEIVIDTFVYDPDTGAGAVAARIVKGAFRFTTGLVGQNDPESVSIGTPLGTIGIRGTIVAGEVGPSEALIVLIGPGDEAGTKERVGRIEVSNGQGTVGISRSGYGTVLTAAAAPTPPVQIPQARIDGILSSVQGQGPAVGADENATDKTSATQGDDGAEEPGAEEAESGSGTGAAGTTLSASLGGVSVTDLSGSSASETGAGARTVETVDADAGATDDATESAVTETAQALGEVTTLADLASVTTGTAVINGSGNLTGTLGSTGTFDFVGQVDFGDQKAQFQLSAAWNGTNSGSMSLNSGEETLPNIFRENGRTPSSDATFDSITGTDIQGFDSTKDTNVTGLAPGETSKIDLRLRNSGNVVAAEMDVRVEIVDTNNGSETLTGSATGTR